LLPEGQHIAWVADCWHQDDGLQTDSGQDVRELLWQWWNLGLLSLTASTTGIVSRTDACALRRVSFYALRWKLPFYTLFNPLASQKSRFRSFWRK